MQEGELCVIYTDGNRSDHSCTTEELNQSYRSMIHHIGEHNIREKDS
jgi:hypothetical protein